MEERDEEQYPEHEYEQSELYESREAFQLRVQSGEVGHLAHKERDERYVQN